MQKYITQHHFNTFTIQLPRDLVFKNEQAVLLEMESINTNERILLIRVVNYIQSYVDRGFENLLVFNFLSIFYDVEFVTETKDFIEFKLIFSKTLNQSIWLQLKHTVFNQYNALIGFSEVLKEVEELDDTDRLMIKRINKNARDMFKNTKLLMEFEQLKDFTLELEKHPAVPHEYMASYMDYRKSNEKQEIDIDLIPSRIENSSINIDHEFFKTGLDLFLDELNQIVDFAGLSFQIEVQQFCHLRLEFDKKDVKEIDFFKEIRVFNDYFDRGINVSNISNRMFHFMYIRLIAEKLGGIFNFDVNPSNSSMLLAEWVFPLIKIEYSEIEDIHRISSVKSTANNRMNTREVEIYPAELRSEVADYFSIVNGTYVLDEWKTFAEKLEVVCFNYKVNNSSALTQIVRNIRKAVDEFDITALRQLREKLKQLGFAD